MIKGVHAMFYAPNADELAGRFQRAETPRTDLPFEIPSCAADEGRRFLLCENCRI